MDLLKTILPVILNLLTELVNRLLQTRTFPNNLKNAIVKLLLKITLKLIDKNCYPVSNLPFIGQTLELVVTDQLMHHIHEHNLMEPLQATCRPDHSTERTLLKVKADIHQAIDNREVICLVLLNLSTVFDTIDHTILLQ